MKTLLLLGPRENKIDPTQTGGAIVLFENLLEQCKKNKINFYVIDTNKKNYTNTILAYLSIIAQLIRKQHDYDHISLHSSRDYLILGIIVAIIGKLFGKKTSLRKFGGDAATSYNTAHGLKKKLLYFIFTKIDILFLEMKYLVTFFSQINPNTHWFPNVRRRELIPNLPRTFQKRFVFISHVKPEKGVDQILAASNSFDDSYIFDIYGPISNPKYTPEYFSQYRVNYHSALPSTEVLTTLNQYDVLMLPTIYSGEGYPGIILEAYSLGLPIIATMLTGIKEITDNHQTGILVEPKNVDELVAAIRYFNDTNYSEMSAAAYKKFDEFDADIQTHNFFKQVGIK
jgi:glycosyltransferase involved in cell wall biosynthesis